MHWGWWSNLCQSHLCIQFCARSRSTVWPTGSTSCTLLWWMVSPGTASKLLYAASIPATSVALHARAMLKTNTPRNGGCCLVCSLLTSLCCSSSCPHRSRDSPGRWTFTTCCAAAKLDFESTTFTSGCTVPLLLAWHTAVPPTFHPN
ncbi:hypothetical protein DFH09DRAFT_1189444 [Mycena vulgaris]|nr:hypothetical protein DFH09DRAFT_1189444 [Mycena vulgaris]